MWLCVPLFMCLDVGVAFVGPAGLPRWQKDVRAVGPFHFVLVFMLLSKRLNASCLSKPFCI